MDYWIDDGTGEAPATARWQLPLLAVAQAGKELVHNEALDALDALLAPVLEGVEASAPPPPTDGATGPVPGQMWATGPAPASDGPWAGRPRSLAVRTAGGWRFLPLRDGLVARLADGRRAVFAGGAWAVAEQVAAPTGGGVVDAEARAALGALVAALVRQGVLAA